MRKSMQASLTRQLALIVIAAASSSAFAKEADNPLLGSWRLTRAVVAPWSDAESAPIDSAWIGETAKFSAHAVKAPGPLACAGAAYEMTSFPPEGLFQGGLPEPAAKAAAGLGLVASPVAGVSLTCDTGLFEFHSADDDTMLFALDNVVWTMSKAYGAKASSRSPEGVVETLLEAHFNGDMGFAPETVAEKQDYLTSELSRLVEEYFAQPESPDEVPVIDGDPFTDTQEYPTRFAVRRASMAGRYADVPVDFSDGYVTRRVVYRLKRALSHWRVDDIVYAEGGTFKGLLD